MAFDNQYLLDYMAKTFELMRRIFFLECRKKSLERQLGKLAFCQVETETSAPDVVESLDVLWN